MSIQKYLSLLIVSALLLLGFLIKPTQAQAEFPADRIMTIAYSPTGDCLAVGYGTGTIRIFDTANGQVVSTITGHTATISSLAWNSSGTQLASGSYNPDYNVRIWNIGTGQLVQEFVNVGDDVNVVTWSPDNQQIVVVPLSSATSAFDVNTATRVSTITPGTAYTLKWSPDASKLAFPLLSGGIDIRDATDYQNITYLGANSGKISGPVTNQIISVAWKPDNSAVAVGTWSGNVLIWDITTGQLTFEQRGNDYQGTDRYLSFVKGLHFNADGTKLTSISGDGSARTWNNSSGQLLESTQLTSPVYAVDWSPDGSKVAYGNEGTAISIVSAPGTDIATATVTAIETPNDTLTVTQP